jgi:hypothetical protein
MDMLRQRRVASKGGLWMAAAVLLSAVGLRAVQTRSYRKFRRSAKKRGVIFQSIYGLGELLQAFGLSFSSPALRYTVVTAAVVTYTARGLGASLGLTRFSIARRKDVATVLSSFLGINYVSCVSYAF